MNGLSWEVVDSLANDVKIQMLADFIRLEKREEAEVLMRKVQMANVKATVTEPFRELAGKIMKGKVEWMPFFKELQSISIVHSDKEANEVNRGLINGSNMSPEFQNLLLTNTKESHEMACDLTKMKRVVLTESPFNSSNDLTTRKDEIFKLLKKPNNRLSGFELALLLNDQEIMKFLLNGEERGRFLKWIEAPEGEKNYNQYNQEKGFEALNYNVWRLRPWLLDMILNLDQKIHYKVAQAMGGSSIGNLKKCLKDVGAFKIDENFIDDFFLKSLTDMPYEEVLEMLEIIAKDNWELFSLPANFDQKSNIAFKVLCSFMDKVENLNEDSAKQIVKIANTVGALKIEGYSGKHKIPMLFEALLITGEKEMLEDLIRENWPMISTSDEKNPFFHIVAEKMSSNGFLMLCDFITDKFGIEDLKSLMDLKGWVFEDRHNKMRKKGDVLALLISEGQSEKSLGILKKIPDLPKKMAQETLRYLLKNDVASASTSMAAFENLIFDEMTSKEPPIIAKKRRL